MDFIYAAACGGDKQVDFCTWIKMVFDLGIA